MRTVEHGTEGLRNEHGAHAQIRTVSPSRHPGRHSLKCYKIVIIRAVGLSGERLAISAS